MNVFRAVASAVKLRIYFFYIIFPSLQAAGAMLPRGCMNEISPPRVAHKEEELHATLALSPSVLSAFSLQTR